VDRYQYFLVLAACVAATLPLELLAGARVWRRPARLLRTVVPVMFVFCAWDAAAVWRGQWTFGRRWVTGWDLPGGLPVEDVVFFAVIPICALLTWEVVDRPDRLRALLSGHRARRGAASRPSGQDDRCPRPGPSGRG
jgi:lycopene cyclase domain-containing protein